VGLLKKYLPSPSPLSSPRWGEEVYGKDFLKKGFFNSSTVLIFLREVVENAYSTKIKEQGEN
jgi:hypothetical protein